MDNIKLYTTNKPNLFNLKILIYCALFIGCGSFAAISYTPFAVIGGEGDDIFKRFEKDVDINSPKSVIFEPDGDYFCVQDMQSAKTLCYDHKTLKKKWSLKHAFGQEAALKQTQGADEKIFGKLNGKSYTAEPSEAVMSLDGKYMFVSSERKSIDANKEWASSISVVSLQSKKIESSAPSATAPKTLTISKSQKTLAVVNWGDDSITFWDTQNKNSLKLINHIRVDKQAALQPANKGRLQLRGAVFSPNDLYVLVSGMNSDGETYIISPFKGVLGSFRLDSKQVRHISLSEKYGFYYISTTEDKEICAISHSIVEEIANGSNPDGKSYKCDYKGSSLRGMSINDKLGIGAVALHDSCETIIFDLATLETIQKLPAPCSPVGVAFSPDGSMLVVASQGKNDFDGKVSVYKLKETTKEDKKKDKEAKKDEEIELSSLDKILITVDSSSNVMYVVGVTSKENVEIGEYKVSTARANIKKPQGEGRVTAITLSPSWYPDGETIRYFKRKKGISLPSTIPPGHPQNYMGAAKISLTHTVDGKSLYRIHGTLNEKTIGTKESAGCIRMKNKEVTELAKLLTNFSKIKGMENIIVALK